MLRMIVNRMSPQIQRDILKFMKKEAISVAGILEEYKLDELNLVTEASQLESDDRVQCEIKEYEYEDYIRFFK